MQNATTEKYTCGSEYNQWYFLRYDLMTKQINKTDFVIIFVLVVHKLFSTRYLTFI